MTSPGWTIGTLKEHFEALREAELRFSTERDRRYTEVKNAEEKALKIKEEADKTALGLQRETQTYKDEKANELREQINSERGLYVTKGDLKGAVEKLEATLGPLIAYVSSQQGRTSGISQGWGIIVSLVLMGIAIVGLGLKLMEGDPVPAAVVPAPQLYQESPRLAPAAPP